MYDFAIVGGGIVGLSTGMALTKRYPGAKIVMIEKEKDWAHHQTGHNSGVIHSGIYYKPGSYKARFAREGNAAMVRFCEEHGVAYDVCGKVIVATEQEELPLMESLYERGLQNELDVQKIGPEELKEIEPHVAGLGAIRVPSCGIADYKGVSRTFARIIEEGGGDIRLSTKVENIAEEAQGVTIETNRGTIKARFLINCAGLHSDRVAKMAGMQTGMKIVPFRGEYYELAPDKRHLVKHLIYPVPNPDFPFLGVHFTRMINGEVHAGPNAVLAFKREGYTKSDINIKDLLEVLTYPGFWKMAMPNMKEGMKEMVRSFSKQAFLHSLQRLIPELTEKDIVPTHAGVRAQALMDNGNMVDDFAIFPGKSSLHVCNAPSPAATASIKIGEEIANKLPENVTSGLKSSDVSAVLV
ncbi:L-2-hydroxyglutarate oxidase [Aneurinibacillus aneurinilyticus]|jgi:L-2-hydroxyglutarate oxidase|uniref:L-2-hydroxyglutarate oxidase n=2 Tax=Aneurinibacillus aneurinilyticus TaxID=1391 RepID=A0A848CNL8_ANEAE|nr:L-2-hydroxyglutarate oxidase [Aneurinibacillus aneurinilyticus]ERI05962.1 FAD dependent oxidoreductase [Aneurinibacillus aneurinilyticus ATCC 12856]MCI1696544.1 L-2-hydroxyglutarate oxidase [Aneurinibacillus aneurinilyticus]MED0672698.1 L-2-hydroxyglutarate oxidase [Aneurinibacillus aneurinilyticus]MED0708526.1 L-2-hydroxyglutarate oxidase [Aneurinibacillus aneurinilyticus]MED0721686.1 L-2-hydroxyglutarate oxidase [Aneurinibacillus aneurinilyticus]